MLIKFTDISVNSIDHPALIKEWKAIIYKADYESNINKRVYKLYEKRELKKKYWSKILAKDDPQIDYMVLLSRYYGTPSSSYEVTDEDTSFIIEIFYIFLIRIFNENNSDVDMIVIKCKDCDKGTAQKSHSE